MPSHRATTVLPRLVVAASALLVLTERASAQESDAEHFLALAPGQHRVYAVLREDARPGFRESWTWVEPRTEEGRTLLPIRVVHELASHGEIFRSEAEDLYEVADAAVSLVSQGSSSTAYSPPLPILQGPLTPGSTWTWSGERAEKTDDGRRAVEATAVFTVEAQETIRVPAGDFACLVVREEQAGWVATKRRWLARDVGLVAFEVRANDSSFLHRIELASLDPDGRE